MRGNRVGDLERSIFSVRGRARERAPVTKKNSIDDRSSYGGDRTTNRVPVCRLIKEQEKSERQEAVRREREIRNQQLLEVS